MKTQPQNLNLSDNTMMFLTIDYNSYIRYFYIGLENM